VEEQQDDVIESCAMLTVPPNSLITEMNRAATHMPAILRREDYQTWLTAAESEARSVLRPYTRDLMVTHDISPRINSLKYDDPSLIQPVAPDIQDCA
jgi:putative SOS response-associated peptidase YedK